MNIKNETTKQKKIKIFKNNGDLTNNLLLSNLGNSRNSNRPLNKTSKFNTRVSENYLALYSNLSVTDYKMKEQLIKRKFDKLFHDTITTEDINEFHHDDDSFIRKHKLPSSTKDWMPFYPCLEKDDIKKIKQLKEIHVSYKDNKEVFNILEKDEINKADNFQEVRKFLKRLYRKKLKQEKNEYLPNLNRKANLFETNNFSFNEKKFDNKTFIANMYSLCCSKEEEERVFQKQNKNNTLNQSPRKSVSSLSPLKTDFFRNSTITLNNTITGFNKTISMQNSVTKLNKTIKSQSKKPIKMSNQTKILEIEKKQWKFKIPKFKIFSSLKLEERDLKENVIYKTSLASPKIKGKRNVNTSETKLTINNFDTQIDELIKTKRFNYNELNCNCDEDYYSPVIGNNKKSNARKKTNKLIQNELQTKTDKSTTKLSSDNLILQTNLIKGNKHLFKKQLSNSSNMNNFMINIKSQNQSSNKLAIVNKVVLKEETSNKNNFSTIQSTNYNPTQRNKKEDEQESNKIAKDSKTPMKLYKITKKPRIIKNLIKNDKIKKILIDDFDLQSKINDIKKTKCNLGTYNIKIINLLQNKLEFRYLIELKAKLDTISKISQASRYSYNVFKTLSK